MYNLLTKLNSLASVDKNEYAPLADLKIGALLLLARFEGAC